MDSVDPVRSWLQSGLIYKASLDVSTPRQALYQHFKDWALHTEGYTFTERPSKFALRLTAAAAEPTIGIVHKVEHSTTLNQAVVRGISLIPVCQYCETPLEGMIDSGDGFHTECAQPVLVEVV